MLEQLFAGVGLGLLVGVLIGLSSSPVVATVVSALAAAMVTLLGFTNPGGKDGNSFSANGSAWRLGGFGLSCALAVLLGLYIRVNNVFAPPLKAQISALRDAGFPEEEARKWVAYKNIGVPVFSDPKDAGKKLNAAPTAASVLFSSGADECLHFDLQRYQNSHEELSALRDRGGAYAAFAERISAMDAAHQKIALSAVKRLFCAE